MIDCGIQISVNSVDMINIVLSSNLFRIVQKIICMDCGSYEGSSE